MSINKYHGEFIEEMTEPTGWPDIDETLLRQRADHYLNLRDQVAAVKEAWNGKHKAIFDGGVWSGTSANAGGAAMQNTINGMAGLEAQLGKAQAYYNLAAQSIVQAKLAINENLKTAQDMIQTIRNMPELDASAKDDLIKGYVIAQLGLNTGVVSAAALQLPHFSTWTPPSSSIPAVIPKQLTPPPPLVNQSPSSPSPAGVTSPISYVKGNAPTAPHNAGAATPTTPDQMGGGPSAVQNSDGGAPADGTPLSSTSNGGGSLPGGSQSSTGMSGAQGLASGSPASSPSSSSQTPQSTSGSWGTSTNSQSPTPSTVSNPGSTAAPSNSSKADSTSSSANAAKASPLQPMANQVPAPLSSPAPAAAPAPAQAPVNQAAAAAPPAGGSAGGSSGGAMGGGSAGAAPVSSAPSSGPASPPPVPLGPPTTPAPPAPPAPGTAPAAATGPGVAPMSAASAANAAAAPAPVPVSASRAERDAIAAATTAGALRRKATGSDPLQRARHIAAALNVGVMDFGFFWITGVTMDGTIVVANSYGLGYIPEGVHLPDTVKMASADEAIPLSERATWATYPILAIQRWAQHHDQKLRAVVATEEQFATFDPGVAKVILTADDMPDSGKMQGRNRLEIIAPAAAQQLGNVSDNGLNELLPPAPADQAPPADDTAKLWFEVAKPLMSTSPQRGTAHLRAFVTYAEHAQIHALHRAHTATDAETQRTAIADWVYWQNLAVMISDAVNATATV